MLTVCEKQKPIVPGKYERPKDIIVTRKTTVVEYKDGKRIEYEKERKVNLTKKINETKKLLKMKTAQEKIAEIEKIFSKE